MSDPTPPGTPAPPQDFGTESARMDRELARDMYVLRERLEAGQIEARDAVDLRISLLTGHLSALRALRAGHFGEGDPATGWISGTAGTS